MKSDLKVYGILKILDDEGGVVRDGGCRVGVCFFYIWYDWFLVLVFWNGCYYGLGLLWDLRSVFFGWVVLFVDWYYLFVW